MRSNLLYGYFGHHKCATTWIAGIVQEVCDYAGLRLARVDSERLFAKDLSGFVSRNEIDFLCYVNADYQYLHQLDSLRAFHVVRDPRDIVVSAYYSHLYSHPTAHWPGLAEHRKKLQAVSKEEGLNLEMAFRRWSFGHMYNWDYTQPNVLEVKMETLTHEPYQEFLRIFEFLGLLDLTQPSNLTSYAYILTRFVNRIHRGTRGMMPVRIYRGKLFASQLNKVLEHNRFSKLAGGREKGQEDIKSHYRKGTPGDWRNHFTEEHIDAFKRNYNELLIKLGYENSCDW